MKCYLIFFITAVFFPMAALTQVNPDFNFTQNTCFGQQTAFQASSSLPDTSVQYWLWDMDSDGLYDDASGKAVMYLFMQANTFPVGLKVVPKSGSADSLSKNVTVNPLPQVNFQADNLCEGKTAVYTSSSTIASGNIMQYIWDFNNDGIDDATGNPASYICGPAQTYITKLTCISDKGCSSFATKTTQVYPNPVAAFSTANLCTGLTTLFTNSSTVYLPDFYIWNFGDGNAVVTNSGTFHAYAASGNYNVSLIAVSQTGCRDTIISSVTINPLPAVSISSSGGTQIYPGNSVTLTASGANSYSWSTGALTAGISVSDSGLYNVWGTDANGCMGYAGINIYKTETPDTITVSSNILTPNYDGFNDFLIIDNIDAYAKCSLKIYNMWNEEVFSSAEYKNDWMGHGADGKQLPDGPYYYIITCDDKPMLKGNINLILR